MIIAVQFIINFHLHWPHPRPTWLRIVSLGLGTVVYFPGCLWRKNAIKIGNSAWQCQLDWLPLSPALQHDLVDLLVGVRWLLHAISIVQLVEQLLIGIYAGIRHLRQREELPQDNAKGPDVAVGAEHMITKRLQRQPLYGQFTTLCIDQS